mgnify:CR=1 FL=1
MSFLIKGLIRLRFLLTSKEKAYDRIHSVLSVYKDLIIRLNGDEGRRCYRVPAMRGVDEDMREWSIYMILEHNVIVNRTMTAIVDSLARNEEPLNLPVKDSKKDVMPSGNPGPEQIEAFVASVEDHLRVVKQLKRLRGTLRKRHPIFGMLDAHGWHCMFCLHLEVHLPQIESVLDGLKN